MPVGQAWRKPPGWVRTKPKRKKGTKMTGRPVNEDRQNAIDLGLKTYNGAKHARCGNTLRYVAGGGCVHCARIIATEQRDALKFLKRHAVNEAEEKVRTEDGVELDNVRDESYEEDADDAEARREADIDSLM